MKTRHERFAALRNQHPASPAVEQPFIDGEVDAVAHRMFAAGKLAPLYATLDDYRGIVRRMLWPSDDDLMTVAETLEQFEAGQLPNAA